MRGRDPETDEFLGPSRSQRRREALDILALATRLVDLSAVELGALPLTDDLRELVQASARIRAPIARKRQLGFLAKAMRREPETSIDALREALEQDRDHQRRETARLRRIELWRERLIEEGDPALTELLDEHPGADAQQLRQLVRKVQQEIKRERPPRAFRELFRVLRAHLDDAPDPAGKPD